MHHSALETHTAEKMIKTAISIWNLKSHPEFTQLSEATAVKPHCYLMLQCLNFIHLQNESNSLFLTGFEKHNSLKNALETGDDPVVNITEKEMF